MRFALPSQWNPQAFRAKTVVVFNLGFGELAVIMIVALIFLGPKMLPEIATGLGKVIREIRKATADIKQDIELDDVIRKPLQELREAATLPPEELKRRDELRAAQRKAEEEARRKDVVAKAAEEAARKQAGQAAIDPKASAAAAISKDAVSAGGTMIASPPPTENLQTLEPIPDLNTPTPTPARLPPPPPLPRPSQAAKATPPADATVIDLHAQVHAASAVAAHETLVARSSKMPSRQQSSAPAKVAQSAKPAAAPASQDTKKKD